MLSLHSSLTFYFYTSPCVMRKSFNGLSGLVRNELGKEPTSGDVFVFLNKKRVHLKLLHWGIRPVVLGRKNYLFAGSHKVAERAAGIYSFFAICKKHEVNPREWLKYTLENILNINHKNIRDLYPQNFKKIQEEK